MTSTTSRQIASGRAPYPAFGAAQPSRQSTAESPALGPVGGGQLDLGVVRGNTLTIYFDWLPHGTVTADAHTIRFESAPHTPGLYRIDLDATHTYIGEARSLASRFNGYRNPGGSVDTLVPRTNRRVQRKVLEPLEAGRTVSVWICIAAKITIAGDTIPLPLNDKTSRLLVEAQQSSSPSVTDAQCRTSTAAPTGSAMPRLDCRRRAGRSQGILSRSAGGGHITTTQNSGPLGQSMRADQALMPHPVHGGGAAATESKRACQAWASTTPMRSTICRSSSSSNPVELIWTTTSDSEKLNPI